MGNTGLETALESEMRQFMRHTTETLTGILVSVATLMERVAGVQNLPDRVTRLEEQTKASEGHTNRKIAIMAIVVAALGYLIPLLKGLLTK